MGKKRNLIKNGKIIMITFRQFEEAYVKTHGQCTSKDELNKFFNLAESLGLKKPTDLTFREAVNLAFKNNSQFKHKSHAWYYDPHNMPHHLEILLDNKWEVLQPEDEKDYNQKLAKMKSET